MGIRILPYLISQYSWVLIISIPLLAAYPFSGRSITKDFFSQSVTPQWNSSSKPTWLIHATDIHITGSKNNSYEYTTNALNKSIHTIKPDKVIFSGDIVDSGIKDSFRPYVGQMKSDWDLYTKMIKEIGLDSSQLITAAGNHELYDIISFNSSTHYANGILYNETSYLMNRYPINLDVGTASVLTINPYQFPSPQVSMTWWGFPDQKTLEKISTEISSNHDSFQIIVTHHPVYMWYPNTGTDTNSFMNIIKLSSNVRFVLTGHLHPKTPKYLHHGDALEVVGTPLFREPKVGVISIDNKRCSYHSVSFNDKNIAIMTHPVPFTQTSGLDIFNEEETEIRALFFGETPGNLSVTGAINGKLSCDTEIKDSVWLCHMPMKLDSGKHTINKIGDWSGEVTFHIGHTISGFNEDFYSNESSSAYTFLFYWILIVCVFMTIPINFRGIGDEFVGWMNEKSSNSNWMMALFGGFVVVKNRYDKTTKWLKIVVFIAVLSPLLLPISLFEIEGSLSVFWNWGYVSNGTSIFMFFGMKFNLYYYYFVIIPVILTLSSIEGTKTRSLVFVFDVLVHLFSLYFLANTVYTICNWCGIGFGLSSPLFIIIPFLLDSFVIYYGYRYKKDKQMDMNELLISTPLTSK